MTTSTHLILVVEDDAGLRDIVRTLLESQQYRVIEAQTGARAIIEARSHRPDLAIIDLGLPDRDGASIIREIRSFSPIPMLVLSARTLETEKIAALDAGADDYVTKPFSTPELMARVRASLRRVTRSHDGLARFQIGSVAIDLESRSARNPEGPVHLTPLEFRVLECLARHAGMIVTQKQLIREAWGPDRDGDSRGVRSYIKLLRQKLEPDPARPRFLITEAGVGYRLVLAEASESAPAS